MESHLASTPCPSAIFLCIFTTGQVGADCKPDSNQSFRESSYVLSVSRDRRNVVSGFKEAKPDSNQPRAKL